MGQKTTSRRSPSPQSFLEVFSVIFVISVVKSFGKPTQLATLVKSLSLRNKTFPKKHTPEMIGRMFF